MVQNNGVERKWEGTTSAMYRLVSEDDFISLDLRQEDAVERAKAYFKTITFDQKMEGIVIKPEKVMKGIAPAMKVRNEDYLHLIYGYDYHFNSKYEKLVRNKKIKQKLRTSIAEYEYGEEMLNIPLAEISPYNESYKEAVMNLLFETTKETEIDPRL
ncbi:hypothetical protein [Listeria fleischmannii]|uniref:hypothetical protein n=1 Tax=Listeria fleischmannii TaxID=1069827 RepID=UPI0004AFCFAC|nr:hypothetical protein [Listeria fleischmannii]